jgi:hypothetical protein
MAQHDYVIANGTGAAVRSDLNDAFAAIVSQNSGTTEPATTYAYQFWADTSAGVLKLRNAANNAWITLRELDGTLTMEDGAVSAPGLAFASDLNTGIFTGGADQFNIATNGVERVEFGTSEVVFNDGGANYDFRIEGDTNANLFFVDASTDQIGLGTSSPVAKLDVNGSIRFADSGIVGPIDLGLNDTTQSYYFGLSRLSALAARFNGMKVYNNANGASGQAASRIGFFTDISGVIASTERLTITEDGKVGINTTGPGSALEIDAAAATSPFIAKINTAEAARIDSSSRLLVGTSSARANFYNSTITSMIQVEGTGIGPSASRPSLSIVANNTSAGECGLLILGKSNSGSNGSNTLVASGDYLGVLSFQGSDGTEFVVSATIDCQVDGTPGADDMPGRLVFSTTADGASSPTERMTIGSAGQVLIGADNPTNDSYLLVRAADPLAVAIFDRSTNDGVIVALRQANVTEGAISVSGSTVTYGGGHLARWSQLPNEKDPSTILKGTVLSNLDEMCEWGDEDNEQLNRMKVSDIEGDPNVAGVFVSTSFDDDGPLDFFCAMTGDMIIRIAEGVTVQRGDLLMSAGDGTAKPQDDDIIRSKTVAKVTSTHVTCTYDDGSYCVPCVLMAC